ncbi:MAG: hypothetical protein AVDCRST_MAG56-7850, partial [uncultured Cytophagales bacterium]
VPFQPTGARRPDCLAAGIAGRARIPGPVRPGGSKNGCCPLPPLPPPGLLGGGDGPGRPGPAHGPGGARGRSRGAAGFRAARQTGGRPAPARVAGAGPGGDPVPHRKPAHPAGVWGGGAGSFAAHRAPAHHRGQRPLALARREQRTDHRQQTAPGPAPHPHRTGGPHAPGARSPDGALHGSRTGGRRHVPPL